jgi:hypothetical protein
LNGSRGSSYNEALGALQERITAFLDSKLTWSLSQIVLGHLTDCALELTLAWPVIRRSLLQSRSCHPAYSHASSRTAGKWGIVHAALSAQRQAHNCKSNLQ